MQFVLICVEWRLLETVGYSGVTAQEAAASP